MAETHDLVRRLLDTSDIARAVPRLPPEVLHRVIEHCGLEACAEIVALATPRQFQRLLDIDLWRAPAPGRDEALDAGRFGEWIEALLQAGGDLAGDRLETMDEDLLFGALAEHVLVFDGAVVAPYVMLHGVEVRGRSFSTGQVCELGGFVVEGRPSSAWEAIVELFEYLHAERPAFFQRLMRGCVTRSDSGREADGFHALLLEDRDQARADLAADRGGRRDAQGYVAPGDARAFLQAARAMRLDAAQPPGDPIVRASLRAIEPEPLDDGQVSAGADARAVTEVVEILSDAGVMARPLALLGAGEPGDSRLALVHAFVESHLVAQEELAFLANAIVGGCGIQGRPFTQQEAADAVLATCNLGLENWPAGWADRNLVTAFQVGWGMLHRDLCRHAAATLVETLADLACIDEDVQWSLQVLRRELMRHMRDDEPWRASQALDALLMLDATAWAVLRALLDECPAMHAALTAAGRGALRVDPAAFTFVARNRDIAAVRAYLTSLASTLAG